MPDIKLGPSGSETTLPDINWTAGGERNLPTSYPKNVDTAKMLDGSKRVNVRAKHQKSKELEWDQLTAAQVATLVGLAELNQLLRFQDNREDATWRWVYVASIDIDTIESTYAGTALFHVVMALEEVT